MSSIYSVHPRFFGTPKVKSASRPLSESAPIKNAIEIHDSTLAGISRVGPDLVLRLVPAYVHQSGGRPGIDPGSGGLQDIDLIISEAVLESSPSEFPVNLHGGSIFIGEVRWDNSLPLPLAVSDAVSLTAVTCRGELLAVRCTGASAVTCGELRYIEEFQGAVEGGPRAVGS